MPFERVLVKGEPPRALFIIRSGHVQVVKDAAGGGKGGGQGHPSGSGSGSGSGSASVLRHSRERTRTPSQSSQQGMGSASSCGASCGATPHAEHDERPEVPAKGERADRGERLPPADASCRLAAEFSLLYQQTQTSNVIDFYANEIFGERSLITRQVVSTMHRVAGSRVAGSREHRVAGSREHRVAGCRL